HIGHSWAEDGSHNDDRQHDGGGNDETFGGQPGGDLALGNDPYGGEKRGALQRWCAHRMVSLKISCSDWLLFPKCSMVPHWLASASTVLAVSASSADRKSTRLNSSHVSISYA